MKKFLALLSAAALFMFLSCGTKVEDDVTPEPAAPEPTVTEAPIEKAPEPVPVAEPEPVPVEEPVVADNEADETPEDNQEVDEEALKRAQELYNQLIDTKQKIDDEDLASYDQKDYDAGVELLSELEAMMADGSSVTDQEAKAKEALGKFINVLNAAYKELAKQARDEAFLAKKIADSVKAGVAEKERYQIAVKEFQDGDSLYSMQAPEKAYDKYVSAAELFTYLYDDISEMRAEAAAAIEAAKQKVAESEDFAAKADSTAPITGDNVAGIEDENEKLLEDDDFENPDDAVADIPEDIDDDEEYEDEAEDDEGNPSEDVTDEVAEEPDEIDGEIQPEPIELEEIEPVAEGGEITEETEGEATEEIVVVDEAEPEENIEEAE